MPNPINQAMRPKIMTPLSRENIFSSSIQAVKGSKDTEELKAAIETNIKYRMKNCSKRHRMKCNR